MSLINDALQRAQQNQPANPTTPGSNLQFRPVEPATAARRKSPLLWPAVLTAAVVMAVAIAASRSGSSRRVSARERPSAAPAAIAPVSPPPQVTPTAPRPAASTDARPVSALIPPAAVASATNLTAPAPVAPRPPVPRLQAIVFNATRPSVIINGKTVFVGNHVGPFRVAAITPGAATLVSESETNVLTLE